MWVGPRTLGTGTGPHSRGLVRLRKGTIMGEFSVWHILIVAAVIVLLFGYKKLPSASKAIAQSLRIFKDETKGLRDDDSTHAATATPPPALPTAAPTVSPEQPTVLAAPGTQPPPQS